MKKLKKINVTKKDAKGTILSTEEVDMVDRVVCNRCAQEVWNSEEFGSNPNREEWFKAEYQWGYNSPWDLEVHEWDLCQTCYKAIVDSFKIGSVAKPYHAFS